MSGRLLLSLLLVLLITLELASSRSSSSLLVSIVDLTLIPYLSITTSYKLSSIY